MIRDHAFQQVGIGLRAPHLSLFTAIDPPEVGWLEIHSENYFHPDSPSRHSLNRIADHTPISCHGIGLSLGSADPLDVRHLAQLKRLIDDIQPIAVSDHLSWSSINGQYFNDLLPIPYTEQALNVVCAKIHQVQETLGRRLLLENPSSYLSFSHATYTEWDFLDLVQQRTGCGLLLDLNNIYVSSFNHGFDCATYLAALNPDAVNEIHLAGFTVKQLDEGEIWIDTHSRPVSEPVWQLYRDWVQTHGSVSTLIEWDLDIPPLEVLLGEADKARQILREIPPGGDEHERRLA